MSDEIYFLHADKHENLLQIDTMTLIGLTDEHQSFLQVDFNTLGIKDAYKVILSLLLGMIKHSQSTQSNKFVISLQYLKKRS